MIHPARQFEFDTLAGMVREACELGLVNETTDGALHLYCYSRSAVYDRVWIPSTLMCRGLVLDHTAKRVVATPFPKFFNVGEGEHTIPDLPFEVFEKLDGSLIIIFYHNGAWRAATKGSLRSEQAVWAAQFLVTCDLAPLVKGTTYLAEAVGPQNRIVIHYDKPELVLLGAYDEWGAELYPWEIFELSVALGWRAAQRYPYASISDLMSRAQSLPADEEGFVLRFSNGLRLKVKGEEYRRIHSLISRCTPLAMWEAMAAGDDLDKVRRDLPEEFWGDFDGITTALRQRVDAIVASVASAAAAVSDLSDKEVGLRLKQFPDPVRRFIFPYRNNGGDLLSGRARQVLFREIRPTANQLPGYVPSYAMNKVAEEAA